MITVLNFEELIVKRFLVNYVLKTPDQENAFVATCMEVQEWRVVTYVLKASKEENSSDSTERNCIETAEPGQVCAKCFDRRNRIRKHEKLLHADQKEGGPTNGQDLWFVHDELM